MRGSREDQVNQESEKNYRLERLTEISIGSLAPRGDRTSVSSSHELSALHEIVDSSINFCNGCVSISFIKTEITWLMNYTLSSFLPKAVDCGDSVVLTFKLGSKRNVVFA